MAHEVATRLRRDRVWQGIRVNPCWYCEVHRSKRDTKQWDNPLKHLAETQNDWHANHIAKAQSTLVMGLASPLHWLAVLWWQVSWLHHARWAWDASDVSLCQPASANDRHACWISRQLHQDLRPFQSWWGFPVSLESSSRLWGQRSCTVNQKGSYQ